MLKFSEAFISELIMTILMNPFHNNNNYHIFNAKSSKYRISQLTLIFSLQRHVRF